MTAARARGVRDAARVAAAAVQQELPTLFSKTPVSVLAVAAALGLPVVWVDEVPGDAQYEHGPEMASSRVAVARRLRSRAEYARVTLAHEIGHAVLLHRGGAAAVQDVTSRERETFAHTFAAELLIPADLRAAVGADFRAADGPKELLRICKRLGVYPQTFLVVVGEDSRMVAGSESVWIRARLTANRYTHADVRLRVVSACFDRDHVYVPVNRSLAGLVGNEEWLTGLRVGHEAECISLALNCSRVNTSVGGRRSYTKAVLEVNGRAMRLHPAGRDHTSTFLICLRPRGETSSRANS